MLAISKLTISLLFTTIMDKNDIELFGWLLECIQLHYSSCMSYTFSRRHAQSQPCLQKLVYPCCYMFLGNVGKLAVWGGGGALDYLKTYNNRNMVLDVALYLQYSHSWRVSGPPLRVGPRTLQQWLYLRYSATSRTILLK